MFLSAEKNCNDAAANRKTGEYLMIESLHIENFRCFKSVDIKKLRRVNIIVGENASGKTALLESIKMGLDGFPGNIPWLYHLRNLIFVLPAPTTQEQFQSTFIDFFYLFDGQAEIVISIEDSRHQESLLRIHFDPSKAITTQPQAIGFLPQMAPPPAPPTTIVPLAFERTNFEHQTDTLLATITPQGTLDLQQGKSMGLLSALISSSYFGGPGESAAWLSQLNIDKSSDNLIQEMLGLFPLISKITSESPSPGMGTIYVDLKNFPRMIPLSLYSGGVGRLFLMMLAVAQFKGGVVLIDEIENGIFYKRYPMVWNILANLAKSNETQLFISSHSKECLKEALPTIEKSPNDFSLLRVRNKGMESTIETFTGDQLEAALEKDGEIR
jgi:hypothetical protein